MDDGEISEKLAAMNVSVPRQKELLRNKNVRSNLVSILRHSTNPSKLHITQATYTDNAAITTAIDTGVIRSARALKEVAKMDLEYPDLKKYVESMTLSRDEMLEIISSIQGGEKEIMRVMNDRARFNDFKEIHDLVIEVCKERAACRPKKGWLDVGEVTRLHRPGENSQVCERIVREHLRRTGGKVVTRFPPEPNGYLHIGHAKAANINWEYARENGGVVYLRFDDTNPCAERLKYYRAIVEDLEWLGFKPDFITASSDYFGRMIEMGFELIRKGKAYVCHLSADKIKELRRGDSSEIISGEMETPPCAEEFIETLRDGRRTEQRGIVTHRVTLSPWRERSVETNTAIFKEMVDGLWEEGSATLRLKQDPTSKNPFMHDLVAFRVKKTPHVISGRSYSVYPSYDFALCVSDSIEDVTHSFCSREFLTRQESYTWLVDALGLYRPKQWEFSRLNISGAVVSKRKIKKLIEAGIISDWDDPRLMTIRGMRRRGFPPNAINRFVQSVGVTYSECVVDPGKLEHFVRDELNRTAERIMCVTSPVKLRLDGKLIFIDGSDFAMVPQEGFKRLSPENPVGLIGIGAVRVESIDNDVINVVRGGKIRPQKFIQWVDDYAVIEMRIYSPLFGTIDPNKCENVADVVIKDSLKIVKGYCERRILNEGPGKVYQFMRKGYFCIDKDSRDDRVVVNLTVELRGM